MTRIQDRIAMLGQRIIANRIDERLTANAIAIVLLHQIWRGELDALRNDRPLNQ